MRDGWREYGRSLVATTSPQFSVCIRTHDRPEWLGGAIASALAQDAEDLEVVVADDGGGNGEEIAARFDDRRLHYHRNPGSTGAMANLRFVSSLARGELVVVLDDDDRLLPDFLSAAAEPMRRDENVGIVFTDSIREAGGGRRAYRFPVPPGPVEEPLRMIMAGYQPGRSAALIRATALEQGEREFPVLDDQLGDLTTWIRTAVAGWGFWYLPGPGAIVSVHRGQSSATESPARLISTLERFRLEDVAAESARRARLADAHRRLALALACRGRLAAARRELAQAAAAAPWPAPRRTLASLAAHAQILHRISVRYPRVGAVLRRVHDRLDPPLRR